MTKSARTLLIIAAIGAGAYLLTRRRSGVGGLGQQTSCDAVSTWWCNGSTGECRCRNTAEVQAENQAVAAKNAAITSLCAQLGGRTAQMIGGPGVACGMPDGREAVGVEELQCWLRGGTMSAPLWGSGQTSQCSVQTATPPAFPAMNDVRSMLQYGMRMRWIAYSRSAKTWAEYRYSSTCRDTGFCQKHWYRTNDPVGVVLKGIRGQRSVAANQACWNSGGVYGCAITTGAPVCSCNPRATVASTSGA